MLAMFSSQRTANSYRGHTVHTSPRIPRQPRQMLRGTVGGSIFILTGCTSFPMQPFNGCPYNKHAFFEATSDPRNHDIPRLLCDGAPRLRNSTVLMAPEDFWVHCGFNSRQRSREVKIRPLYGASDGLQEVRRYFQEGCCKSKPWTHEFLATAGTHSIAVACLLASPKVLRHGGDHRPPFDDARDTRCRVWIE